VYLFSFLDLPSLTKAAQVCESFFSVAYSPPLWSSLRLSPFRRKPVHIILRGLLGAAEGDGTYGRLSHTHHLDFAGCARITSGAATLLSQCPQITELSLRDCTALNDDCCRIMFSMGTNLARSLRNLDLSFCMALTDFSVAVLVKECPNLEELNISRCNRLSDHSLTLLGGTKINSLDISMNGHCVTLSSIGELIGGGIPLTKLNIGGCSNFNDEAVSLLVDQQLCLTHLLMNDCFQVTNTAVEKIANSPILSKSLQQLSICGCTRITYDGVRLLKEKCANLYKLDMRFNVNLIKVVNDNVVGNNVNNTIVLV